MNDEKTMLNIYQRMANVMAAVSYVQKEAGGGLKYSIVSHDAVTAKCRPAILEQGIIYFPQDMEVAQNGNRTEVQLNVRFQNIDNPNDYLLVPSLGYGIDQQDKGPGKAISYAVKYALLKALGLEAGDDPDLDQDTKHEPSQNGTITQEQQDELCKLLNEVRPADAEELAYKRRFLKYFGYAAMAQIPTGKFEAAKTLINSKRKSS